MTLKECYRILELSKTADLDEIKKAYRRLAFALHPDLNPGMPDAARRFQEVNEAYVLLSKTLEQESARDPRVQHRKAPETTQTQAQPRAQTQAQPRPTSAQAPGPGPSAQPTGANPQNAGGPSRARPHPAGSPHGYKGSSGPSAEKHKPGAAAGAFAQSGPRAEQYGPTSPNGPTDFDFARASGKIFNRSDSTAATPSGSAYDQQEKVLGEILNDPFARRVFEDIYSQLKQGGKSAAPAATPQPPRPKKKKKISLEWGKRKMSVDLTHGLAGAAKNWLRSQLDQEQILEMPAANIVPGARLRLQVGVGLFGHSQSVEVILPPGYLPGNPIRLKGLGRKLGAWRGDLYLRVVPQGQG